MFKTLRDRMNQIDHRDKLFLERELQRFSPVQQKQRSPTKGIYIQEPVYSRLNLLATYHKTPLPHLANTSTEAVLKNADTNSTEGLNKDSVTGKSSIALVQLYKASQRLMQF